jgi:hypothetical protein
MKDRLEKKLEGYKKQLEEAKALYFKLQGAIEATELLIKEGEKDTKK